MDYPLRVSLCGIGGQGIILAAVIIGTTAVTKNGLYATQTQSYGSEARGGQCQAELIIDTKPINSPICEENDILISLFQAAYDKYISSLREDGILIFDPDLVTELSKDVKSSYALPATKIATALGNRTSANMVVLGYIAGIFDFFTKEQLVDTVQAETNPKFLEVNLKAIDAGYSYAKKHAEEHNGSL